MLNKTSIIILSYNTLELTRLCIESIRKYTPADLCELIVVDNGSTDGSAEWLAEQPELILIVNDENRGFPGGCNEGARLASGDSILLLNSDTIVTPHWLENLRTALFSSDRVGAVGCLTNHSGNMQMIKVNYTNLDELEDFARQRNISDPAKWHSWRTLVGFCLMIKRTVYADIGELDEALSPGNYEDDDICLRMRMAGYETLLCEDTFIHHFGSASFKRAEQSAEELKLAEERYEKLLAKNFAYMQKKWGIPAGYQFVNTFVTEKLGDRLSSRAKVTIVGCDYRADPFIMLRNYPEINLCGVALSESAAQIASVSYPAVHIADIMSIDTAIQSMQDVIILLGDILPDNGDVSVIEKLMTMLKPGGIIYCEQLARVYENSKTSCNVSARERMPLVSIMIPTYNMPEIFAKTMASAAAQDYPNTEIIVCDNSTNSDTAQLMERYKDDSRVRYYRNTWAHSKAENFAPFEDLARGEYLQWLMHDDILVPQKISKMAQVLIDEPEVTLVTSRRGVIDGEDNIMPNPFSYEIPVKGEKKLFTGESVGFVTLSEMVNFIGEPSAVLFRRSDLKNHYWQADCRGYLAISDVAMWLELMEKGDLVVFRDPLSYYRRHSEQEGQQSDVVINSRLEWYRLVTEYYERGVFIKNPKDYVHAFKKIVYEYDNIPTWKKISDEVGGDLQQRYEHLIANLRQLIASYDR